MSTLVVIDQPVRVDVDEDVSPHVFWDFTTSDITSVQWADTEDAPLEVTFDADLDTETIDAIVRFARAIPEDAPDVPVPPATSPQPVVKPLGIGSLRISWLPVTNETSVMYDVYLSDSSPVAIAPENLLESTAASMSSTRFLPDGVTELVAGTTYYAAIQARSEDQYGPVSAEGSGSPVQVTGPDIAANAVNAEHVSANSIEGEHFAAQVVISNEFATAESGERTGMSADEGLFADGPDGEKTLQVKGGQAYFDGEVNARNLTVVEGASWSGSNLGAPGASTMMGDKLARPGNAPTVEAFYDTITLDGGTIAGDDQSKRRGIVWQGSNWFVASGSTAGLPVIVKFSATGAYVDTLTHPNALGETNSLALVGTTLHAVSAAFGVAQVFRWNATTGEQLSTVELAGTDADMRNGVIGTDGTNLILAYTTSEGALRWQKYSTSGAKVGSEVNTSQGLIPRHVVQGTFDLGVERVMVAASGMAYGYSTTGGGFGTFDRFPSPNMWRGFCWTGSQFVTLGSDQVTIYKHTANLKDESFFPAVPLAAGVSWYDGAGTTHETAVSPRPMVDFPKRAKYRLRTSGKVPSGGGADDPNGARFYVGRSTGRTKLERQSTVTGKSPGQYVTTDLATLTLPTGSADATNPPPASNNFPASTPYEQYSEATIATGRPYTSLKGSGFAELLGLVLPWIHYNNGAGSSIPNNAFTMIPWPGAAVDNSGTGDFNYISGGKIQVLIPGVYEISTQIAVAMPSGNRLAYRLMYNDVAVATAGDHSSNGGYGSVRIAGFKQRMAAGSTIHVEAHQNSGSGQSLVSDGDHNWIQLTRVHA